MSMEEHGQSFMIHHGLCLCTASLEACLHFSLIRLSEQSKDRSAILLLKLTSQFFSLLPEGQVYIIFKNFNRQD